jgi:hypothetical protein
MRPSPSAPEGHRWDYSDHYKPDVCHQTACLLRERLVQKERKQAVLIEQSVQKNSPGSDALAGRPNR